MKKILFVCTGNICRSPTADGIMRHKIKQNSLSDKILVDSAGIQGYHVDERPDNRSIAVAKRQGVDISTLATRKFSLHDYKNFDLILAMDNSHYDYIISNAPNGAKSHIDLFLRYAGYKDNHEVADPYYGNIEEFERTFAIIEKAVDMILSKERM